MTPNAGSSPPIPSSSFQPNIVKKTDLWLTDGTIIIRTVSQVPPTTNTQPTDAPFPPTYTLFKVHRSVLAKHSPVFSGLFGLDQQALESASESFEGIPVMELPEPAEHVESLLKALYFPRFVFRP